MARDTEEVNKLAEGRLLKERIPHKSAFLWAFGLSTALVASLLFGLPHWTRSSPVLISLCAASAMGYFVISTYCVMRLRKSGSSGWFLYSSAFLLFLLSYTTRAAVCLSQPYLHSIGERAGFLLTALPLAGALLLVLANRISGDNRGRRGLLWRPYARAFGAWTLVAVLWKTGCLDRLGQAMSKATAQTHLASGILMAGLLVASVIGSTRMHRNERDEICGPLTYWAIAMLMASTLSSIYWKRPQVIQAQLAILEISAIVALLVGLCWAGERLQREAKEKMTDLDAMQKISWSLVGAATLPELCSAFADAMASGFNAGPVVVYLTGNEHELDIAATSRPDESSVCVGKKCSLRPERRPGFHSGHTSRAYAGGGIVTTSEIYSDTEFMSWRAVAQQEGLVVSVPLPHQGRVLGVVNLFLSGATSLGEGRKKLLESIAAAVAPAIENARLKSDEQIDMRLAA